MEASTPSQILPRRDPAEPGIRRLRRLLTTQPLINIISFGLTLISTYRIKGPWYAVPIVLILLAHEMGHYLACRRYGVKATLPFFIPFPFRELNPFGTLGAIIRIKGAIPNRRALFDVGIAGPIAGFVLALPALYLGLHMSRLELIDPGSTGLFLGRSLLFDTLIKHIFGDFSEAYTVVLHPLAYAGWAGLFVTALNLLPVGQLDGGHVVYAMFGRSSYIIFRVTMAGFIAVSAFFYTGWLLFITFLLLFGEAHPPTGFDHVELDRRRMLIGFGAFVVFLLTFTPVPFEIYF